MLIGIANFLQFLLRFKNAFCINLNTFILLRVTSKAHGHRIVLKKLCSSLFRSEVLNTICVRKWIAQNWLQFLGALFFFSNLGPMATTYFDLKSYVKKK